MSFRVAVGYSQEINGYQAGLHAGQQAFEQLERTPIAFGFVIASHTYDFQQLLAGLMETVGTAPVLGFSTAAVLTSQGYRRRSVAVALFSGDGLQARAGWWSDFSQDSRSCVHSMLSSLQPVAEYGECLFVVADGLNGDFAYLCDALSNTQLVLAGCLAGGDPNRGRTVQLGGRQSGSGGLAAVAFNDALAIGSSAAHGWQPVGALARLTSVQGMWVRSIDNLLPNQTYARLFGYTSREWALPPLNQLVRQYPLRLRDENGMPVRSPVRIEPDGSLRMNCALPANQVVEILIGSVDSCLAAARLAARQALEILSTQPKLALVLVDIAWQTMFEAQVGEEIRVIRQTLGTDVPILGGYTFGQILRPKPNQGVEFLNQHIQLVLFGDK